MAERGRNSGELLKAQAHIWNQIFNFGNSFRLKAAVELGIPDVIHNHGQPMKLSDLVASLPINPAKAHCIPRLMRGLVHSGFFLEKKASENEQESCFSLTPTCHLLLKDNPFDLCPFLLAVPEPCFINSWRSLSTWLQNDDPNTTFNTANGMPFWDYLGLNPTVNDRFNEAMAADSRLIASVTVRECKGVFEGVNSVVDVGGGTGTMAAAIADAFPHLKCTVFDQTHVVGDLQESQNLKFVGGNMFEAIPPADAILLKWILHSLSDEDSIKLLKKCKEAIPSKDKGGKVIIIDMVLGIENGDHESIETQLFLDMQMMINVGGKERNKKDWEELLCKAGFSDYNIFPVLGLRSLIEAYP